MATRKKKREKKMISNTELYDILVEEMSPAGKIMKLGIIISGGIDIDPYVIGHRCKMHPAEIHQGVVELKHKGIIEKGLGKNTVNIKRS